MKRFRDVIFWCHLICGALAGIVIFIMSVTGVLLTYEKQIEWSADTSGYSVQKAAEQLAVRDLIAKARESKATPPTSLTVYSSPDAPALASFPGGKRLYLDPYTGGVFGEGSERTHAFFGAVTDWHRWLGTGGDNRAAARAVTGSCNLIFLFLVMSGFYLWWPRKWTRKSLRAVTWFRTGQGGKARDFNWHNVFGFWSALPLFVVVLSGVVISFPWAGNLVYRIAGEEPPVQQQRGSGPQQEAAEVPLDGLEPLMAKAKQQVENWNNITVQVPQKPDVPVTFALDSGNGGQPQYRAQLALDPANGEVTRWEQYSDYTPGRRMRTWFRFAHTGEFYGIIGQTIAGIASFAAAFLVFTGISLALRRFFGWRGRRVPDSV
ncbi:MAG TPA: PepSY-associated TM helix domain-containing protein [Pyrinomonadaceae bacterium]|nr:PepSY-associated TM helix domain-containing protein [Pyrinomonadaceae bacterium]